MYLEVEVIGSKMQAYQMKSSAGGYQLKNVHVIRQMYGKQCYIGFVGPQNAGKSSLLNALWGKEWKELAKTGMKTHTKVTTRYRVADQVYAIDFPGSDSLDDHLSSALKNLGHMNNFLVYVIQYNGTPNKELISTIKNGCQMKKVLGKSSKTLFCLNKAFALKSDDVTFSDEYRKEYVNAIREDIKSNPFDENEENLWKKLKEYNAEKFAKKTCDEITRKNAQLKQFTLNEIKDEDFIFTDWKHQDTNRGIEGPEDVRKRIKKYLVEAKVRSEDNLDDI